MPTTKKVSPTLTGTYHFSDRVPQEGTVVVSFASTQYTLCQYGPDGNLVRTALVTMERLQEIRSRFETHQSLGVPGTASFADWLYQQVGWTLAES